MNRLFLSEDDQQEVVDIFFENKINALDQRDALYPHEVKNLEFDWERAKLRVHEFCNEVQL